MIKVKAIVPKRDPFNPRAIKAAVDAAYKEAAEGALEDFQKTTATWDHQPDFEIKKHADGYLIGTRDDIYGYVDKGTRPHIIVVKNAKRLRFQSGYRAKTRPGYIGSQGGGASGDVVFKRSVNHPGSTGRGFSVLIRKKWQAKLAQIVNAKLRQAVR